METGSKTLWWSHSTWGPFFRPVFVYILPPFSTLAVPVFSVPMESEVECIDWKSIVEKRGTTDARFVFCSCNGLTPFLSLFSSLSWGLPRPASPSLFPSGLSSDESSHLPHSPPCSLSPWFHPSPEAVMACNHVLILLCCFTHSVTYSIRSRDSLFVFVCFISSEWKSRHYILTSSVFFFGLWVVVHGDILCVMEMIYN